MRLRYRAAGLLAAAVTVVGLAALPASAAQGKVAIFDGNTTSLNPPVQQIGGSGTYSFQSGVCEEASPAKKCGVTSSGTYTNIVCGTGSAHGSAFLTPNNLTFNYSITFVSGVGLLTGGATGVVDIVPTGIGKGKNCVTKFTVLTVSDP